MNIRGNGHTKGMDHGARLTEPYFEEDEEGATLDSGAALCRFDTAKGGRLTKWQWRRANDKLRGHYAPTPREYPNDELQITNEPGEEVIRNSSFVVPEGRVIRNSAEGNPPALLDLVDLSGGALIDHFMPLGTKPEEFAEGAHKEYGDFVEGRYKSQVVDTGGEIRIGLLRDGAIRAGNRVAEVRLAKSAAVRPKSSDIAVLYRVINSSARPLQILFSVEFNLYAPGLSSMKTHNKAYYLIDGERPDDPTFNSMDVSPNATAVALVNPSGEMALQLGWDRECDLWRMPSPSGGVRLLAVWRIQLPPRDNWAMGLWMAPS